MARVKGAMMTRKRRIKLSSLLRAIGAQRASISRWQSRPL